LGRIRTEASPEERLTFPAAKWQAVLTYINPEFRRFDYTVGKIPEEGALS